MVAWSDTSYPFRSVVLDAIGSMSTGDGERRAVGPLTCYSRTSPQDLMPRVLVIDDTQDMLDLVQVILEDAGYEVEVASDGKAGLAAQRRSPADLVITDIFMPDQDGLETIVHLRREFPEARILACSGGGRLGVADGYLRTAQHLGADAVLSKPFEQEELLQTVRDLLPRRG
ncbi:MAG: response regulator [Myxococcota bacterium]